MILQIKLLSDLCVASGESYNSFVDTDVAYDEYGVPYIPAKRLKGCIREAALELVEWETFDKSDYEDLFGKEGKKENKALFSLDNAYLQNYQSYVRDLANCEDENLVHPQRVLDLFTYTRTQTALDENGIAEKGSLHTIRVINKGLVFEADLQEMQEISEKQKELLKAAVSMVKHIGLGRTRGLGLVEISLLESEIEKDIDAQLSEYGEKNKINYVITLNSPILCKGAEGTQEKTRDYIEGGKILGVLAQREDKNVFGKLMAHGNAGNGIVASNAYICDGKERYTPSAASLQKLKDTFFEAGSIEVADMLNLDPGDKQWTPIGDCYISKDGYVKNVDVEVNYHHKRPEDKAIGKAVAKVTDEETGKEKNENGSAFYQLESIRRGQQFAGFIFADKEKAPVVEACLRKSSDLRMGYGRNAEYGRVSLEVTNVEILETVAEQFVTEFAVKLNSAAILYNEFGIPVADVACLKTYLAAALDVEDSILSVKKAFLKYETIGGFNVTWHRRKPSFTALGKGTVCSFTSTEPVDIGLLNDLFIGERTAEGYGEIEIRNTNSSAITLKKRSTCTDKNGRTESDIVDKLRVNIQKEELINAGRITAQKLIEANKGLIEKTEISAVLSKLILIVKGEDTWDAIKEQVKGIESPGKQKLTDKLVKDAEAYFTDWKDDSYLYDKEMAKKDFFFSYLNQIKYVVYRQKKGGAK